MQRRSISEKQPSMLCLSLT